MPPIRAAKSTKMPPRTGVKSSALFVMGAAYQSLRTGSKNVACSRGHRSTDAERLFGRRGAPQQQVNGAAGAAGAAHDPMTRIAGVHEEAWLIGRPNKGSVIWGVFILSRLEAPLWWSVAPDIAPERRQQGKRRW